MKIILTESQLNRLINEQVPLGNLLDAGAQWGTGPEVPSAGEARQEGECLEYKSTKQIMRELFMYARKTQGQPKTTDQKIQQKIISLGNLNNLETVMGQINTIEELGSVLNGYQKMYTYPLSNRIDDERSKKVWSKVKRFNKNFVDSCKKRLGSTKSA